MQKIDLQINARYVLPMSGKNDAILRKKAVIIDNGQIIDVLDQGKVANQYQAKESIELNKHILMPGFTNHYCSLGASAFHHIGFDSPFNLRLQNHLLSLQKKHMSDELVELASELSLREMFKSGTTSFNSHYLMPSVSAKSVHKHSIIANFSYPITSYDFGHDSQLETQLAKALQLRDDFKHHAGIEISLAIDNLPEVSDSALDKVAAISNELGLKLEVNLNPLHNTVDYASSHGSLKRLNSLSLLSPDLQLNRVTHLNRQEIELIAKTKTFCSVSPQSQLIQSTALAPMYALMSLGANIGLGSDNFLSSNLNLIKELQLAAWLGKLESRSSQLESASKLIQLATQPLASDMKTGTIAKGYIANLCAMEQINSAYNYCDPYEQIVYTSNQQRASHLWINGQTKVANYQLTDIDENYLNKSLGSWHNRFNK